MGSPTPTTTLHRVTAFTAHLGRRKLPFPKWEFGIRSLSGNPPRWDCPRELRTKTPTSLGTEFLLPPNPPPREVPYQLRASSLPGLLPKSIAPSYHSDPVSQPQLQDSVGETEARCSLGFRTGIPADRGGRKEALVSTVA